MDIKKAMHTSIFRPSTTVPFSFSRALSASALLANVTNPNPCMQDKDRKKIGFLVFFFLFSSQTTLTQRFFISDLHKTISSCQSAFF
jgi:hypothetical protein